MNTTMVLLSKLDQNKLTTAGAGMCVVDRRRGSNARKKFMDIFKSRCRTNEHIPYTSNMTTTSSIKNTNLPKIFCEPLVTIYYLQKKLY